MQTKTCFSAFLAAAAATLIMATPAHATLLGRDLDNNTVTDAFYDTDLNITWLRDANVNGTMNWTAANTWANGYSIGIYSDWRLPTTTQPDASCDSLSFNCIGSEMGHLWYTELGNTAGNFTNAGDFQNLESFYYWSGTEDALNPFGAWIFNTSGGFQQVFSIIQDFPAMAVRSGDVAIVQVVPEPESLVLALTALSALALLRRRRPIGASAL